jgi:hypothetical protein
VLRTLKEVGDFDTRISKSQIAFSRKRGFAWVWRPKQYLKRGAPLVLSIALPKRNRSKPWKEIIEPVPGRFMHHLELHNAGDVDRQVAGWMKAAWEEAG